MSRAVDHLVAEYLAEEHPRVARALRKDAPSTAPPLRSPFGKKSLQEVVMAYRVQKTTPAAVGNGASSEDDEAQRASQKTAKTSSPSPIPKPTARKVPIADSDSDDESVTRPAAKKTPPKYAPKKAAVYSDSSDEDEPVPKNSSASKMPAPRAEDVPAQKAVRTESEGAARRTPHHLNEDGTFRRFQRIDPAKVTFDADALRDNRPGREHLVLRQNQEMMRTKGKGFNKLKQKNKGKFYGAGVDLSVRAYQFPDSDDD
ncbi:SRP40 C-inal domain containing protein [Leishmania donovani]|uniref:SRP40_-_C-terminal_domain_containing_protein_-_putative n=3 Tax=Leishmania donovani species complex TaxID=38574 RepID=A0A6L0WJC7_LEIIN|nr:conserved hypothetical protein [Leishmania infantum JPCM5]XP_003858848.1 hypothetical protein, conserved [Leishmania donovani]CAC9456435.1 SRP40_-_C-terminal_domain_containing_protein_-_putative [Leishmania infantum]AYU76615.1 SRP40, C-terminal domain containing protein, putative [Leishmania donovani]TPP46666.1 SRP40, C-terminal domain family protein [Leishmania donovani]TPP51567.1 SRP40, C-terminal domain family protein [Leishmania donovani]CAJ1986683.1 SRP40 C-inal domain containing prot|eukprot:XP_001463658.1 conserved hypothetical protein [Leishmania infantum JPCM5]